MCAVIGAVLQKPTIADFNMIKRVFLESKIRGLHATGISFLPHWSDKVVTIKEAIPADKFVELHMHNDNLVDMISDDGNLYLIGHCRYSTSDLEYNQPIYNNHKSIVHNGVITQELPEKWKDLYGYECMSKNDSELVLHSNDPLNEFSHMSMGVCELTSDKKLRAYRNGKRPLYLTFIQNGVIITSTSNIAKRANIGEETTEANMNTYYCFDSSLNKTTQQVRNGEIDYQKVNHGL
jgi:glutamine phosphoribosylpyrophosphate amidotransferase